MIRLSFIAALLLGSLLSAQTIEPVTISPTGTPGFQEVTWPAYSGRTYYLQTSPNLIDWTVNPSYVIGDDMLHGMVIGGVTPLFARVISFQGLPTDDNDGDGLSNHHEITSSLTNPDTADSDGDGASDGEESTAQTDPNDPESGPAFVVEITMPPVANSLQIFLDENFIYLGDNSALVSPLPGTVTTSAPQTPGNWHVEFWDTAVTRTAIVDFRRFQASPSPRRLTLLNVREIWPTNDVEAEALTLEIPANGTQAPFETAWNDLLPTHGGYGQWSLLPVLIKEVSFAGAKYHELKKDDLSITYSAPQWLDNDGNGDPSNAAKGEKDYSVAYTRNTKPSIGAKFTIPGSTDILGIKVRARGSHGIEIPETAASIDGIHANLPLTPSSTT